MPCEWVWIASFFVFDFRDVAHFRSGGLFRVLVVRLCHLLQLSFFGPMFSFEAERPAHSFTLNDSIASELMIDVIDGH